MNPDVMALVNVGRLRERFLSKVAVPSAGGCMEWLAERDQLGYGRIYLCGEPGGRKWSKQATHVAWFLDTGEWPQAYMCHRCDNPSCVNVDHLFLGTARDNNLDRIRKGRSRQGTLLGDRVPTAVLTWDRVRDIRRRLASGETQRSIAADVGIAPSRVSMIKQGKAWRPEWEAMGKKSQP